MYMAAMKGELGPLAQAIAKYQTERRIYEELEKLKKLEGKMKNVEVHNTGDNKNVNNSLENKVTKLFRLHFKY